ncbi:MAG: iron-containing alcohol dehydrogenase [Planctomycetes bacterium]|nr:iron-containing alcohol dehydrogenase [Planctomycetota bacterium]
MSIPFDFQPRTRIVFGTDRIDTLGNLAGELGARRVLVVSDPGIVEAGHTGRGMAALEQAGIETHLFDGVVENPTTEHVEAGLAVAKRYDPELIVGLGGGSSMDCAKGINFLYTNGGRMQDYRGVGKALKEMLPMIAVPTTAGTGSETQSFALISDAKTHEKMACGDKKASFRIALLDPVLTVTQPAIVTALTGIDALAHTLETYVSKKRNAASLAFSREAWLLLGEHFAKVLDDPNNLDARGGMQLGACFAGLAIENSMLGATHALANPLTARYGIIHGQAIGIMLPHVIRFNGEQFGDWYRDLLDCTADTNGFPSPSGGTDALAGFVADLAAKAKLPSRLQDCGVERGKLATMAEDATKQWTGTFNPRPLGKEEALKLYEQAF